MLKKKNLWMALWILAAFGIVLATYLLYEFYSYNPNSFCNLSPKVNCSAVTVGSLSTIFAVPVSLIGLIGYGIILFAGLTKRKKLALGMSAFGMLFCLRISILEFFFIKIICPICIACQTVMLLVFIISLYLNYNKTPKQNL
jgi:uncharacterized membrane protein